MRHLKELEELPSMSRFRDGTSRKHLSSVLGLLPRTLVVEVQEDGIQFRGVNAYRVPAAVEVARDSLVGHEASIYKRSTTAGALQNEEGSPQTRQKLAAMPVRSESLDEFGP
jgi:hypothetical protein